jgi:hypothetical protein
MKICTVCQRYYEDSVISCAENHGLLTDVRVKPEIVLSEKSVSDAAAISNFMPAPQASAEEIKDNANDGSDSFRKPQGFSPEQDDLTAVLRRAEFLRSEKIRLRLICNTEQLPLRRI